MKEKYIILIIDDEAENRSLMVNYLERNEKFILYSASNGEKGIEIAREEQPCVIILDWQMPEMNGLEVLKQLKENANTSEIPVMMHTGIMTDSESLRTAMQIGAHDFIRKPIEPIELEARINSVIRQKEHQVELMNQQQRIYELEKKQLQLELEAKEREVINYAKSLSGKNELFSHFLTGIKSFIQSEKLSNEQEFKLIQLSNELKNSMNALNGFEEFSALFNQLNPKFADGIEKLGISFTENEKHLLCFLKLNLQNKEIATLLFVSVAAVEKAKYRLKQKLKLQADESLNDFISNL